jgi:hypothetical protein
MSDRQSREQPVILFWDNASSLRLVAILVAHNANIAVLLPLANAEGAIGLDFMAASEE